MLFFSVLWRGDGAAGGVDSFGDEGFCVEGAVFVFEGEDLGVSIGSARDVVGGESEVFSDAEVGDVFGFLIEGSLLIARR